MPAPKRRRVTKWHRLPINCEVDPGVVIFIDGTKSEFDRGDNVGVSESDSYRVHPDTGKPMSVCYQYILFLYPSMNHLDSKAVRSLYPSIELWSFDGRNYMFKSAAKFDAMAMDIRESVLGFLSPQDFANIKGVQKSSMNVAHMKAPKNCQQVTVDLMDPNLAQTIFRLTKECIADDLLRDRATQRVVHPDWHRGSFMDDLIPKVGKIGKIVATGPLVGEYPYDRVPGMRSLRQLTYITHLLDIPSSPLTNLYYELCNHNTLRDQAHVQEVEWDELLNRDVVTSLDSKRDAIIEYIKKGQLSIDRWVIPFKVEGAAQVYAWMTQLASATPDIPIYTIIDPGDTEKVRLAQELGIQNYIVDEAYRDAAVLARLNNAKDIKFRRLYQE